MDNKAKVIVTDKGDVVLDDPVALAVVKSIAKQNCANLFDSNIDRIKYFAQRIIDLGRTFSNTAIVILNVDYYQAALLADVLMPNHDWQQYRDRGEVPIARGLVEKQSIQKVLDETDADASLKLKNIESRNVGVIVMSNDIVEVFSFAL